MKDVIISITGIQYAAHDTDEAVELVTDGKYCFKDGHGKLTYDESELTGMEGTTTSFLISPGEVILSREGTLTSQMVFREGTKNTFLYDTPTAPRPWVWTRTAYAPPSARGAGSWK